MSASHKSELYGIVFELVANRWKAKEIGLRLGITERRVQQILAEQSSPPTPFEELPFLLRERCKTFAEIESTRPRYGRPSRKTKPSTSKEPAIA